MKLEKMIKILEEIPEGIRDKAYSLDITNKKLQLAYDKELYKTLPFEAEGGFLRATLFNGVRITMEEPPFIKTYNFEG